MQADRQQMDPVRLFGRRLLMFALFVLVVIAATGVWSAFGKQRESGEMRREAELRLADLAERSDQLNAKLVRLETDRGKEEALRERYELGREGERLIVIVDAPVPEKPTTTPSVFQRIRDALPW